MHLHQNILRNKFGYFNENDLFYILGNVMDGNIKLNYSYQLLVVLHVEINKNVI